MPLQLVNDEDMLREGGAASAAPSHIFFRVTSCRPSRHKRVPLPAAIGKHLSQQDMCVTVHPAMQVREDLVVSLEPAQAHGIRSPISVLSALHADIPALRDGLVQWSTKQGVRYSLAGLVITAM